MVVAKGIGGRVGAGTVIPSAGPESGMRAIIDLAVSVALDLETEMARGDFVGKPQRRQGADPRWRT